MKHTTCRASAWRGTRATLAGVAATMLVGACAQMPVGPSVSVMPGPYKPFEVFTQDDEMCRGWAAHSIGLPGHDAAAQAFIASTAVGTALGALVGAAGGGERGVGSGAAAGAAMGAMAGAGQSGAAAWSAQRRYDIAYSQCMYSRGNVVPQYGYRPPPQAAPPPPPTGR
jgi:hypothetical protein